MPPFLQIVEGGREDKWRYYKLQMTRYGRYIENVIVFNSTILERSFSEVRSLCGDLSARRTA